MRPRWDNRYYKLTYQPTTGRIISLFDKSTKRELLASEGLGFFTLCPRNGPTPWSMVSAQPSTSANLAREKYDRPMLGVPGSRYTSVRRRC